MGDITEVASELRQPYKRKPEKVGLGKVHGGGEKLSLLNARAIHIPGIDLDVFICSSSRPQSNSERWVSYASAGGAVPIPQMRKLRVREVKLLTHSLFNM